MPCPPRLTIRGVERLRGFSLLLSLVVLWEPHFSAIPVNVKVATNLNLSFQWTIPGRLSISSQSEHLTAGSEEVSKAFPHLPTSLNAYICPG